MPEMIRIVGLAKSFNGSGPVLSDVSFSVGAGEAVAVIGASGAGKTTLLRVLCRVTAPDSGEVRVGGVDAFCPQSGALLRGRIGIVHQQHGLPTSLSVATAVLAGELPRWSIPKAVITCLAGPTRSDMSRAATALASVGLEARLLDRVGALSVGQRQRVAIARTILQDPDVVLADEPVASVDPVRADVVLSLLLASAGRGRTLVCTLNDVEQARRHFPRVIALRSGRLVFDGPPEGLTDEVIERVYGREEA